MEKVIIVGGGYGGLRAVERLASNRDLSITLIDKNSYHYLQTEAYRFMSGRLNTCDATYDLRTFCDYFENVSFVQDEAVGIEGNALHCKKKSYPFDKLIIAAGAKDFIPASLQKYAYCIKDIQSAYAFKQTFLSILFERTTAKINKRHIVIGGAGQSGVELAADLMSIANDCGNTTGRSNEIIVTLIEGTDAILPGVSRSLQQEAAKRLFELGVNIKTGDFIEAIDENCLTVGGECIDYDLFLFSGGIEPSSFIKALPFDKNEKGFLLVNEKLQIASNIFAIGDAAVIKDSSGSVLPPTAQLAEQSAEYVAKVINESHERAFEGRIYGMFTALGYRYGVGELFGRFHFKGRTAYFMKEMITKLYAFGIRTKINSAYFRRKKV